MAETLESDKRMVSPGVVDSGPPVEEKEKEVEVVVNAVELRGGGGVRAEIDTSAPFESVKEAVTRFGGLGFWKPNNHQHHNDISNRDKLFTDELHQAGWEEIDAASVEEQAAQLEKELILKEKDTLKVLKELEATKMIVEDLKSKLQMAESSVNPIAHATLEGKKTNVVKEENKENDPPPSEEVNGKLAGVLNSHPSSAPGLILMELKQAKLNLTKTTSDLAEIRASVESYNRKIEKERMSLEKTRERLSSNSSRISSVEEELNRTRMKLQLVKDGEGIDGDGKAILTELHRLNCEAEMFKKLGKTAKAEVMRVMSKIEQTKAKIKTTEIRLIAARKMKEAARAAEAVALAEIKALEKSCESSSAFSEQNCDGITLTHEEYSSLACKAQEATKNSKKREMDAMLQVDEANISKTEILKRVDEAMEEVKTSKKALEDALNKVDEANKAKLGVEEALRKWRSEHGQKRKSVQGSTKFKISGPTESRRDSQMLDVNGINLASDAAAPVLKPTLSIGQILSRKLLVAEEFEPGRNSIKRKVSLGQMLGKQNGELSTSKKLEKENVGGSANPTGGSSNRKLPTKRKKFGFARFSVLLAKQSGKKKKKPTMKML